MIVMMRHLFLLLLTFLGMSLPDQLMAEVYINEVCSVNKNTISDEYGESSDWIELYNTGNEPINLAGWFISDKLDDNYKWQFPNVSIAQNGYLLVFASGRDLLDKNLHTNFKLSSDGEILILSKPDGELVDQVNIPALEDDISYGRIGDYFQFFAEPTPGIANQAGDIIGVANPPERVDNGYFFDKSTAITFKCNDPNCIIYYTLDGSDPDDKSNLYEGSIVVDTTTSIRVVSIAPNLLTSDIATNTIFINVNHTLPIVCLTADPDEFYSIEDGILVAGENGNPNFPFYGSNFWLDRKVKTNFEYFEHNTQVLNQTIDAREHGGTSARTSPQKTLRLVAEEKYGAAYLDYPFFEQRDNNLHKAVILRNASGDFNHGHLRDAFLSRYFQESRLHFDILAYQPVAIYINGAYYGLINLREKSDEFYIANLYGIDPLQLDILEEDTIIVSGNYDEFDRMYEYVISNDLTIPSHYKQAKAYFDYKNIAEYFIVQTGLNNNDCLHNNIKYWRERKDGAKWRYIVFDLDLALNRKPWSKYDYDLFLEKMTLYEGNNKHVNIFKAFLANEEFKNYFLNRHADLFNTIFRADIFQNELEQSVSEIDSEMINHLQRWPTITYESWTNEKLPVLYTHMEKRPDFAFKYLIDYFELKKTISLGLDVDIPNSGTIKINTLSELELPWKGNYFDGVPVKLSAIPSLGYRFSHWTSSVGTLDQEKLNFKEINFTTDEEIVAHFSKIDSDRPYIENVWWDGQAIKANIGLLNSANIRFKVYDVLGRMITQTEPIDFESGKHTRQIHLPKVAAGIYFLTINDGKHNQTQSFSVGY